MIVFLDWLSWRRIESNRCCESTRVVRSGDISTGQIGKHLQQIRPIGSGGNFATVNQNVGLGCQVLRPLSQPVGVIGQGIGINDLPSQFQSAGITV
jgi:hypothetical protein